MQPASWAGLGWAGKSWTDAFTWIFPSKFFNGHLARVLIIEWSSYRNASDLTVSSYFDAEGSDCFLCWGCLGSGAQIAEANEPEK